VNELRTAAHTCKATWEHSPAPPETTAYSFEDVNLEQDMLSAGADVATTGPSSNYYGNLDPVLRLSRSQSNEVLDEEEEEEEVLETPDPPSLDQLSVRGKGEYYCHLGLDCDKGGVVNGQRRMFKRNCDYKCVFFHVSLAKAMY
jgi:hypothetical protein